MLTPLRVLIIEDSEDDALLLVRELNRGGYEPVFKRVDTPEAMKAALAEGTWDVIISDYAMPRFSAPAALALLKETGLDVPFIIVSGAIGEQTAVDLMKAGAQDFVMKGNLSRLIPATKRELGDAEVRRERKQAEQEYKQLINSMNETLWIISFDGKFLEVNDAAVKKLGYSREELLTMGPKDIDPHLSAVEIDDLIEGMKSDQLQRFETEHRTKDGKSIPVEINSTPVIYHGKAAIMSIARDITERKRMEKELKESEERYRVLFQTSPDAIAQIDREGRFITANPAMVTGLGFSAVEELIGKMLFELVPQDVAQRRLEMIRKAGEAKQIQVFEDERDGRWFHNIFVPITTPAGGETTVQVIARDITEQRKAQGQLEHSFIDLAETVSRAMVARDPYTASHQRKVAELARLVGAKMGLEETRLQGLYIGGLLHDIGKISIPESILSKPGKLTEEEWNLIRSHAKRGYEILKDTHLPWPVADMAVHHHERLDGSGYPHGISGDSLSLEVRILSVCDVVEAMGSHRPYRPARRKDEVLEELLSGKGTKYDAAVVDVVLELIENGEFQFERA